MSEPRGYEGTAWNPATASENRIHSDEVAQQYGFRGGLVPGVTVYALLAEPAVRSWGLGWLEEGGASVVLRKPLYDGEYFRVSVEADGEDLRCALYGPDDVLCADGSFQRRAPDSGTGSGSGSENEAASDDAVGDERAEPPKRRNDPPRPARDARPDATRAALEELRLKGLGCLEVVWDGTGEQARYRLDPGDMPDVVRADREGWAHPGFSLCLANWVLSNNVMLGPWIHVESRVRHYAAIPLHSLTRTEARVVDLFERRGHEFVDLDVAVFDADDRPLLSVFHRAIYQLRAPV